jgi:hypothetical protein
MFRRAGKFAPRRRAERGAPTRAIAPLLATVALTGCGTGVGASSSSPSSEVVVRVGNAAIDRAEVDHWASAIERGNTVGTALGQTGGTPREKALKFLISSRWIIGEAEAQGLSISNAAVQRGLQEKIDALPNGRSEFDEELTSTGQTLADVKLEVKSALRLARLRDAVAKRAPAVTSTEVASYYSHHLQKFYLPDRRVVYLIEGIQSRVRALALAKQARPVSRLTTPWFREVVPETPEVKDPGKLAHMVFTTTPGRVAGPMMFFGHWVLAVVKKLIPAGIQPLAVVKAELLKTLAVERRERTLRSFAATYVRKWTASTSCSSGYVVPGCSQYRGGPTRESSLTSGETLEFCGGCTLLPPTGNGAERDCRDLSPALNPQPLQPSQASRPRSRPTGRLLR